MLSLNPFKRVFTVDIYLKGGAVVSGRFHRIHASWNGDKIKTLKWVCVLRESIIHVSLEDIIFIKQRKAGWSFTFRKIPDLE